MSENTNVDLEFEDDKPLTLKDGSSVATLNVKDLAIVLITPYISKAFKSLFASKEFVEVKTRLKITDDQIEGLQNYLDKFFVKILSKLIK